MEGEKGEQENRSPDEGAGRSKFQYKFHQILINTNQYKSNANSIQINTNQSKLIDLKLKSQEKSFKTYSIEGGKRRGPRTTIKAKQLEVGAHKKAVDFPKV